MFDVKKITAEIIDWIAEYFRNNAVPETKAVIGISGGKDSSVVAALCVRALGKERVLGVIMPQGEQSDIDSAYDICRELDINYTEINIADAVESIYDQITCRGLPLNDIAVFNTPARVRMTVLYALSGIVGGRVANTSNLSEDWVGYATKFGDSAGDFSPLSDLTVTEVKAVGIELGLPARFVEKTPIDGLCGKTDEENLGFSYAVLDRYIREGVCDDDGVRKKIDRMNAANQHKFALIPAYKMGLFSNILSG